MSKIDQLIPRIAAACATVIAEDYQDWIRHSKTIRDKCLSNIKYPTNERRKLYLLEFVHKPTDHEWSNNELDYS